MSKISFPFPNFRSWPKIWEATPNVQSSPQRSVAESEPWNRRLLRVLLFSIPPKGCCYLLYVRSIYLLFLEINSFPFPLLETMKLLAAPAFQTLPRSRNAPKLEVYIFFLTPAVEDTPQAVLKQLPGLKIAQNIFFPLEIDFFFHY